MKQPSGRYNNSPSRWLWAESFEDSGQALLTGRAGSERSRGIGVGQGGGAEASVGMEGAREEVQPGKPEKWGARWERTLKAWPEIQDLPSGLEQDALKEFSKWSDMRLLAVQRLLRQGMYAGAEGRHWRQRERLVRKCCREPSTGPESSKL